MAGDTMDSATRRRPPNPFGDFAPSLNFYPSTSHRKVVHRVTRSLESCCGMILLTGEIGIGKTSVSLFVQEEFSDRFAFVLLANPFLTPAERVDAMLEQLEAPADVPRTMDGLEGWAVKMFRKGRPPVLIIDECHLLQRESFSQLQVLSNLREGGSPLLQMLLVGQVEIADRLREPGMEAFNQRIGVRCEVEPMNLHDTREYVQFKLDKADYPTPEVFEKRAVERIWRISGGLPRLINHACSYALDQVTFCGLTRVTPRIVDDVVRDSMYRDLYEVRTKGGAVPWARGAMVAGLLACGAGAFAGVGHFAGWWGENGQTVVAESGALQKDAESVEVVAGGDGNAVVAATDEGAPIAPVADAARQNISAETDTVRKGGVAASEDSGGMAYAGGGDPLGAEVAESGVAASQKAVAPRLESVGVMPQVRPPQEGDASASGQAVDADTRFSVNELFADELNVAVPGDGAVPPDGGGMDAQGMVAAPGSMPSMKVPAQDDVYVVVRPSGAVQGQGAMHRQPDAQAMQDGVSVVQDQALEVSRQQAALQPQAMPDSLGMASSQGAASAESRVRDGGAHPVVGAVSVDAVAWADNDEARIAVLDGHVLREGGALPSGVVLLRIGGKDLLMEYQGAIYRVAWSSQPVETE